MTLSDEKKEVREMAKKEEGCEIKVKKVKDGYEIKVSGFDLGKCLEMCLQNCNCCRDEKPAKK